MEELAVNVRISTRINDGKDFPEPIAALSLDDSDADAPAPKMTQVLAKKLLTWGVEARGAYFLSIGFGDPIPDQNASGRTISQTPIRCLIGIRPVPLKEKTETRFTKIFFIWLSANTNILSYVRYFPVLRWYVELA
jgi:hypothetical protein